MKNKKLFDELKYNYDRLTGSQKRIGKYVLDHYERVAFMSAVELAEAVGVSDATIIRFTRNIGFSGYVEFKQYVRSELKAFEAPDSRISKSLELVNKKADLVERIGQNDIDNLRYFLNSCDKQLFDQAAELMCKARCIYVIGKGTSSIISLFLSFHLQRMGFSVICLTESMTVSPEKIVGITGDDLLIGCGFPRYSKDTYHAILFAKKNGAKVVTITDSELSAIAVHSDVNITARLDNITFFHSYIVPMEICNVLLMKVLEKKGKGVYDTVRKNTDNLKVFEMML